MITLSSMQNTRFTERLFHISKNCCFINFISIGVLLGFVKFSSKLRLQTLLMFCLAKQRKATLVERHVVTEALAFGDAIIQKNTSKTQTKHKLKFLQFAKHKDYIYHLHSEFKDYVLSAPHFDFKRNTYCFQTVFHLNFNKLADIFLDKNGKKIISCFFEKNCISPISLAYLFMDDSGLLSSNKDYVRKGLVLNTQGFTVNQVKLLSDNLNKAYYLNS